MAKHAGDNTILAARVASTTAAALLAGAHGLARKVAEAGEVRAIYSL